MALTKEKKNQIIDEVASLLGNSKMTVVAAYQGTPVKAMQTLRRTGRESGTTLKVVKNRLVKKALESNDSFKSVDTSVLNGMLLYAFNDQDEVAPAQVLADFAKTNPSIEFIGAISAEGKFLDAEEVKALAKLPSKPELIAGVINILNSPVRTVTSSLSGGLSGILSGLEAKAQG